jgi:hypothetical protein
MALVERLMHLDPDPVRHIAVHEFAAACYECLLGPRTVVQIKTYYVMDAEDAAEFDALVAKVNGTNAAKLQAIFSFEQVFILAEQGVTFYQTPAEVRVRLGI